VEKHNNAKINELLAVLQLAKVMALHITTYDKPS
jgi:hypothetical protein